MRVSVQANLGMAAVAVGVFLLVVVLSACGEASEYEKLCEAPVIAKFATLQTEYAAFQQETAVETHEWFVELTRGHEATRIKALASDLAWRYSNGADSTYCYAKESDMGDISRRISNQANTIYYAISAYQSAHP